MNKGIDLMKNDRKLEWIWKNVIPKAYITLLASRGGVGKSGFALYLCDHLVGEGYKVVYVDAERCGSHIKDRMLEWKLKNAGEICFTGVMQEDGYFETCAPNNLSELGVDLMAESPDFIVIDSLTSIAKNYDINSRPTMAIFYDTLSKVCSKTNAAILLLCHTRKTPAGIDAELNLDSIAGSGAITDLARSVLLMDYGSTGITGPERVLHHVKANCSAKAKDIVFQLTSTGVTEVKDGVESPVIKSGTKIADLKALALVLAREGKTKKEISSQLKLAYANPNEVSKVYDWLNSVHNFIISE